MCSPDSMNAMGMIGSIAGQYGAYSAAQSQSQLMRQLGQAQQAAYNASATIDDQNAAITLQQAGVAVEQGSYALQALKAKGREMMGTQRAVMGASGLATTSGTPALILSDTATQLALDVEAMRLNNRRTKWGFDVQATNYRNKATQARYAGAASLAGMNFAADVNSQAATTSLLSGITSSLIKYSDGMGMYRPTIKTGKTGGGK